MEVEQSIYISRRGMVLLGVISGLVAQSTGQFGSLREHLQALRQRVGVPRRDHEARSVMIDDLRQTALVRHHHRKGTPHGLENRDPETLADRRKGEDVKGREHSRHIMAGPEKHHVFFDTKVSRHPFEISPKRTIAHEHQTPRIVGTQLEAPKEGRVVLFGTQRPHVSDHKGLVDETQGMPRLGSGRKIRKPVGIDAVVDHLHPTRLYAGSTDNRCLDRRRHGHHPVTEFRQHAVHDPVVRPLPGIESMFFSNDDRNAGQSSGHPRVEVTVELTRLHDLWADTGQQPRQFQVVAML